MKHYYKKKVAFIFGTRPEAVKVSPVILELNKKSSQLKPVVIVTGQHKEMLYQILKFFKIKVDYDLNIMKKNQILEDIVINTTKKLRPVLDKEKPDIVVVQGDTTSAFVASLCAFYNKIPVAHIEAGLRSFDKFNPFPEEINRKLIDSVADIYFAPTGSSVKNLLMEGVCKRNVYLTGNTVVDALFFLKNKKYEFKNAKLKNFKFNDKRVILLTTHRRENLGEPLKRICLAIKKISSFNDNIEIIFPVHLNPKVRVVVNERLGNVANVHLVEPLSYPDLIKLMQNSFVVLTDSGGIQEESPSFNKPVLVMRRTTERMEAIRAGCAKLIGTDTNNIVNEVKKLLNSNKEYAKMTRVNNPFGDGKASVRIVKILKNYLTGNKE